MRFIAAFFFCVFLVQSTALADVLTFKSGSTKTGRILAESEDQILFQEVDGVVSEVSSNTVSIVDRSDVSGKGGKVSFFTNSPRKQKKTLVFPRPSDTTFPEPSKGTGASEPPYKRDFQEASFDNLDKMLQAWLEKHPETKAWLEQAAEKAAQNSAQLDELVTQAKQGAS